MPPDDAIAASEKVNAKQLPQMFYARHMEPGLCGYGDERVLIDLDTMKLMAPSFVGKPVFVGHNPVVGQFMRGMVSKLPDETDGYIVESFFNPLDGWLWVKMLLTSDAAFKAVKEGNAVSNAYLPKQVSGAGGEHHAVDYDRKIGNAEFTHLAIVPDPRYENAKIFTPDEYKAYQAQKQRELSELQNSKGSRKMFKFFRNKKEEVTGNEIPEDAFIELSNGKTVTLKEMQEAVAKDEADKAEKENAKKKTAALDAKVKVGDTEMTVGDLAKRYEELSNKKERKNEDDDKETKKDKKDDESMNESDDDEDEEKKKKKKDDEKENESDDDGDKAKKEKEKENAKAKKDAEDKAAAKKKNFDELNNAHLKKQVRPIAVSVNQVERGKQRYGSASK